MKQLKLWNGRDPECTGHFYVCAHSRAHASRIASEAYRIIKGLKSRTDVGDIVTVNEIKDYWSEGCWGNAMNGITPEIGVWHSKGYPEKPVRIYPEQNK